MREFAYLQQYKLWMAPTPQKVVITLFLLCVAAGLGLNIWMGVMKHQWTPEGVADYIRGNEERMMFGKTTMELTETTHTHLFTMPLLWLVLGHLFVLTTWPAPVKGAVTVGSFIGMAAELAAPWLVRLGAGWVWVKFAGGYLMGAGWLCMTLVPIYEMWWVRESTRNTRKRISVNA
jgi:hypothetical protein